MYTPCKCVFLGRQEGWRLCVPCFTHWASNGTYAPSLLAFASYPVYQCDVSCQNVLYTSPLNV